MIHNISFSYKTLRHYFHGTFRTLKASNLATLRQSNNCQSVPTIHRLFGHPFRLWWEFNMPILFLGQVWFLNIIGTPKCSVRLRQLLSSMKLQFVHAIQTTYKWMTRPNAKFKKILQRKNMSSALCTPAICMPSFKR